MYNPPSSWKRAPEKIEYLESIPWILKQSLFLENEMLKKLRTIRDVGYLIFVTDDTKIKGNRAYDLGNYYEALEIYEQVMACFAWLELKDPSLKDRLFSEGDPIEGIVDENVVFHERPITNEADRLIETETSKQLMFHTIYRVVDSWKYHAQFNAGLHEHVPF